MLSVFEALEFAPCPDEKPGFVSCSAVCDAIVKVATGAECGKSDHLDKAPVRKRAVFIASKGSITDCPTRPNSGRDPLNIDFHYGSTIPAGFRIMQFM